MTKLAIDQDRQGGGVEVTNTPVPSEHGSVSKAGVPLAVVVVIACLAQFVVVLDSSIVNVALPDMRHELGLSVATQQWVVDGYMITFGGLLLLASRVSDLFGRRRMFQLGLMVFILGSLLGGLAHDSATLLTARFVQGAGAAGLAPASLSLITASHTRPRPRARALAWWGLSAANAGAAGVVLGGILTASLSWRWVFFVNIPIGAGLFAATLRYLSPSPTGRARARVDAPGAALVTLAVASVIYGVSSAPTNGWGSARVLVALVAGLALFGSFIAAESRTPDPLIPLGLFSQRNIRIGNLLILCLGVIITAPLFFLSLYLQQVLGESALRAGLSLLPMTLALSLGVLCTQRLLPTVGPIRLLVAGGVLAAGGLVWLAQLPTRPAYATHVLAPTLLTGIGMSAMLLPMTVLATAGVDPRDAGVASGLINMSRQLGGALGLAALVTVASTLTRGSHASLAAATTHGYNTALMIVAAVSLLTAALATLIATRAPAGSPSRKHSIRTTTEVTQ